MYELSHFQYVLYASGSGSFSPKLAWLLHLKIPTEQNNTVGREKKGRDIFGGIGIGIWSRSY